MLFVGHAGTFVVNVENRGFEVVPGMFQIGADAKALYHVSEFFATGIVLYLSQPVLSLHIISFSFVGIESRNDQFQVQVFLRPETQCKAALQNFIFIGFLSVKIHFKPQHFLDCAEIGFTAGWDNQVLVIGIIAQEAERPFRIEPVFDQGLDIVKIGFVFGFCFQAVQYIRVGFIPPAYEVSKLFIGCRSPHAELCTQKAQRKVSAEFLRRFVPDVQHR